MILSPSEASWAPVAGPEVRAAEAVPELPPGLQAAKIIEFANGPAAILLERSRDRYVLRRFLGESAPLSPAFVDFISRIRWIPADRLDRIEPPRLIVTSG